MDQTTFSLNASVMIRFNSASTSFLSSGETSSNVRATYCFNGSGKVVLEVPVVVDGGGGGDDDSDDDDTKWDDVCDGVCCFAFFFFSKTAIETTDRTFPPHPSLSTLRRVLQTIIE